MANPSALFLVRAARDGRSWLVGHRYAGTAAFSSEQDARRHVEEIRAAGVEYQVIRIAVEELPIGEEKT